MTSPAWSPDGRQIAFVSDRNGDRELYEGGSLYNADIFLMNADGTGVEQLTFDPGDGAGGPAWSPDGSSIAFVSGRDGPLAIFAIELASDDVRRISNNDLSVSRPSWSPDGAWIAYIEVQGEFSHVWVMAADGSEARTVDLWQFLGVDTHLVDRRHPYRRWTASGRGNALRYLYGPARRWCRRAGDR